jgi:hypothetical protein
MLIDYKFKSEKGSSRYTRGGHGVSMSVDAVHGAGAWWIALQSTHAPKLDYI